jgi:hypothetical protein
MKNTVRQTVLIDLYIVAHPSHHNESITDLQAISIS